MKVINELALAVVVFFTSIAASAAPVVWGSFDASRINYGGGCLTCSEHDALRGIIGANNGLVGGATPTLSAAYLSGVGVFYTSLLSQISQTSGTLSGDEKAALQNWIAGGGTLIVSADHYPFVAYESFTSSYGITNYTDVSGFAAETGSIVATHPITAGVTTFNYLAESTFSDNLGIGLLLANNDNGQAFMRVFEPATGFVYGGRILVFGDHNMFTDTLIGNVNNTRLANNIAAWAAQVTSVPEPAPLALLSLGLVSLAASRLRKQ